VSISGGKDSTATLLYMINQVSKGELPPSKSKIIGGMIHEDLFEKLKKRSK